MASSEIEIASSSPFGCVLRDHNRTAAAFQKNLKGLVRENLHSCISVSSGSASDENSRNHHHHQNLCRLTDNQDNNVRNIDGSSTKSSKQARILDQWAVRQAQEMVSTIERQSEKAGLLIKSLRKSSHTQQQNSKVSQTLEDQSDNLSVNKNHGASSLVQIWEARLNQPEARLNRSNSMNNNRTMSVTCHTETASSIAVAEESTRHCDIAESSTKEDSLVTCPLANIHFKNTNAGEHDKVRIVDIIRKLTSDGNDPDQLFISAGDCPLKERRLSSGSDQTEHKMLSQVVNSPKIRGRQAFNDLLLQMERERYRELGSLVERQAVSKFNQRGRIQSLLRLRFLQRDMAFKDQHRPQSSESATSTNSDRSQQGSIIMHLRERFIAGVEQATTMSDSVTLKSTAEMPYSYVNTSTSTQSRLSADSHNQETCAITGQQSEPQEENSALHTSEVQQNFHEESCASSAVAWQGTSLQVENFHPPETSGTTPTVNDWDVNELEEEEEGGQQYFEQSNYDWFRDIARPRSYWEDQRKAWYEEKLSCSTENDEIRKLLERRTVSNFLTSDLRDKIDQLMVSRVERQVEQEDEELDDDSQERMGQLMLPYLQRHSHPAGSQEEKEQELDGGNGEGEAGEEEERVSEEEEEESSPSHQYMEATVYFDQSSQSLSSPYPFRSWNYNGDHEVADGSEQAQITPLHLPQASNQDRRYSPSISHSLIEMELVYDLKGQMEQLQHEMSELRKSIQSCMEMHVSLQHSLKQEVHPDQGNGKNSVDRTPNKRSCCICYGMQVDSFLYRCGHMCTCINCAHELRQSSGKCPICRAPIEDVVRAFMQW